MSDNLEDLGVQNKIMLKGVFRKGDGGMGCTDMADDRYRTW
jgi:hypothetical protein